MKVSLNGEPESGKSFFSKCFKDEPKRKLISLIGNKRKKIIKSKYIKRFVKSKNYIPNLMKKMQKNYSNIFNAKYHDKGNNY